MKKRQNKVWGENCILKWVKCIGSHLVSYTIKKSIQRSGSVSTTQLVEMVVYQQDAESGDCPPEEVDLGLGSQCLDAHVSKLKGENCKCC